MSIEFNTDKDGVLFPWGENVFPLPHVYSAYIMNTKDPRVEGLEGFDVSIPHPSLCSSTHNDIQGGPFIILGGH